MTHAPRKVQLHLELRPETRLLDPLFVHEPKLPSFLCFIEGDPPPEPPAPDAPKFTQKDIDSAIGKRLAEERKKFADYDELKSKVSKLDEVQAKLAKLEEENEVRGKSEDDKRRHEADKAAKAIERERQEHATKLTAAEKRAQDAETRYRSRAIREELGAGLDGAKVLATARAKAVKLFMDECTVELDEHDKVSAITYGGVSHKSVAEAAAAFLKDNDFLASAGRPSGGGSQPPSGGAPAPSATDGSAVSLLSSGLAARRGK